MNNNYHFVFIDTSSIFHLLYHGYKKFEQDKQDNYNQSVAQYRKINGKMTYISTLRGYLKKIHELRQAYPNSIFIHALDPLNDSKNFRKKINASYKSNRSEKEEDLITQLNMLPKVLNHIGEISFQNDEYEADDIISTLIKKTISNSDKNILVYSRDKDLLQMMINEDRVHFLREFKMVKRNNEISFEQTIMKSYNDVKEKMLVNPLLIPQLLALVGDKADGIEGINGIGIKKASEILNEYGDLHVFLNNLDKITNSNLQKIFSDRKNIELLIDNTLLTYTNTEVPLPTLKEKLKETIPNLDNIHIVSKLLNINEDFLLSINHRVSSLMNLIDREKPTVSDTFSNTLK